jgi:hypothetical protein
MVICLSGYPDLYLVPSRLLAQLAGSALLCRDDYHSYTSPISDRILVFLQIWDAPDGFDFLDFNHRHYNHRHYNGKLLIKPTKKKVLDFCKRI